MTTDEVLKAYPDLEAADIREALQLNLQSTMELEATREKVRLLEQRYDAVQREPGGGNHVQELTLQSLKHLINQLKEEIALFEAHA